MTKLRTEYQLRHDSCDKSLRQRVTKYFADAAELHAQRAKLKTPTQRRAVVEWFYGCPLEEITGDARELAEAVAVEHRTDRIIYFSEARLGARLEQLECAPLLREFHKSFARQIEKEIEAVTEHLLPAYEAAGIAHEVEQAAPVVRLADLLRRAKEHAEGATTDAGHAMVTTFRFLET